MPETSSTRDAAASRGRDFRVTMMHHPSLHVPDLAEAESWFERVFGRVSIPIRAVLSNLTVRSDWPRDYSIYTPISDVFFDTIDPKRFVIGGVQRYAAVDEPHLKDFGFSVDGTTGLYRQLRRHGIRVTNSLGEIAEGDDPPTGPNDPAPFYTLREETGRRDRFYPDGPFPGDPRTSPGWVIPPVTNNDPLGIEFCSHHTILTVRPDRAISLYAGILGGDIVHQGRDELRGTASTYVHLAGSILDFAVPDKDTAAHKDLEGNGSQDTYHAITWKVADLERAERHLQAHGVRILLRSPETIVTDPATSLGVPWGFSAALLPADPRANH